MGCEERGAIVRGDGRDVYGERDVRYSGECIDAEWKLRGDGGSKHGVWIDGLVFAGRVVTDDERTMSTKLSLFYWGGIHIYDEILDEHTYVELGERVRIDIGRRNYNGSLRRIWIAFWDWKWKRLERRRSRR